MIEAIGAGLDYENKTVTNLGDCGEETKGAKKHQDGIGDVHQAKTKATGLVKDIWIGGVFKNIRLDNTGVKDIRHGGSDHKNNGLDYSVVDQAVIKTDFYQAKTEARGKKQGAGELY